MQINNYTALSPAQVIQLCLVDLVKSNKCFERNAAAVHFTIFAIVSEEGDTGWKDTVSPTLAAVGTSRAVMYYCMVLVLVCLLIIGVSGTINWSSSTCRFELILN